MTNGREVRNFSTVNLAMWGTACLAGVSLAVLTSAGFTAILVVMAFAGLVGLVASLWWSRRQGGVPVRRRRSAAATWIALVGGLLAGVVIALALLTAIESGAAPGLALAVLCLVGAACSEAIGAAVLRLG